MQSLRVQVVGAAAEPALDVALRRLRILVEQPQRGVARSGDEALVAAARDAALRLLDQDPHAAARHIERWLGGRADYLNA